MKSNFVRRETVCDYMDNYAVWISVLERCDQNILKSLRLTSKTMYKIITDHYASYFTCMYGWNRDTTWKIVCDLPRMTKNKNLPCEKDRLHLLKYAIGNGCEIDPQLLNISIICGNYDCMTYIHQTLQLPITQVGIDYAVTHGRLSMLKYCEENSDLINNTENYFVCSFFAIIRPFYVTRTTREFLFIHLLR